MKRRAHDLEVEEQYRIVEPVEPQQQNTETGETAESHYCDLGIEKPEGEEEGEEYELVDMHREDFLKNHEHYMKNSAPFQNIIS
jgi:predicted restriction endonuclease